MPAIKDTKTTLEIFEKKERIREQALQEGNSRLANKCYHEIHAAFVFLRNENTLHHLYQFLISDSIAIQLSAATYLLIYDEDIAMRKLREKAANSGINSLDAKMVMQEWDNGNIVLSQKPLTISIFCRFIGSALLLPASFTHNFLIFIKNITFALPKMRAWRNWQTH